MSSIGSILTILYLLLLVPIILLYKTLSPGLEAAEDDDVKDDDEVGEHEA